MKHSQSCFLTIFPFQPDGGSFKIAERQLLILSVAVIEVSDIIHIYSKDF